MSLTYLEIKRRLETSKNRRLQHYAQLYKDFLDASSENKLYQVIENVVSLIYAPDNVIFDVIAEKQIDQKLTDLVSTLRRKVQEDFLRHHLDVFFYDFALFGFLFGCIFDFVCVRNGEVEHNLIFPWEVAMLYEDGLRPDTTGQVFGRFFYLPIEVAREIYGNEVVDKVSKTTKTDEQEIVDSLVQKLKAEVISADKDMLETIYNQWFFKGLERVIPEPMVYDYIEGCELWIKEKDDNGEIDWFVYEFIGDELVDRRRNPVLKGVFPFVYFVPNPVIGYSYGRSEIHYLKGLQEKLKEYTQDLNDTLNLYLKPPLLASGIPADETFLNDIQKKLGQTGSVISLPMGVNVQPYEPKIDPKIILTLKEELSRILAEQASMTDVLFGKPAKNVRSASYANILAMFASSSLKKKALMFESFMEEAMTLHAQLLIEKDKELLPLYENQVKFRVEIFAHTSSPILMMQYLDLLMGFSEIIPPELLVDILPLPMKEVIKENLKRKQAMEMAERLAEAKEKK